MDADAATAGVPVPWAASQPGANGGEETGADGGEKLGANGGKKLGADGGKKPATAFARVWSAADEVRILEGLAAYTAAQGQEPRRSQLRAALEGRGLNKSEFTVTQIYEKVRQLRTKYANLRSTGGVPVPAGGDEARKYELSKAIWGDKQLSGIKKVGASHATNASASVSANANANANVAPGTHVRRGVEELQGLYPCLALAVEGITDDESLRPVLKRAFQLISDEKARELNSKMRRHMAKEVQMTLNQTALRSQVLDLLIKSMD